MINYWTKSKEKWYKEKWRMKMSEIDPAPETKPARPDPIDIDEDKNL